MKKHNTIRALALILLVFMTITACGKTIENRYINSEPGYKQRASSGAKPLSADGGRIISRSMDEYLKAKESSGFTADEGWLSWEQFSALGEFYWSFWWEGQPNTSYYKYVYTHPEKGTKYIYRVGYDKIPEDTGVTNIKEYYQWYHGKEIPNDFFEVRPLRSIEYFTNPDLTEYEYVEGKSFFVEESILYGGHRIVFFYDGFAINITKLNLSDGCPFDSSEDPEIIRRLTNTETYMDAIKELMDPKNAQAAK